ncbi:MAG: hypothetical protein GOVbin4162_114 [Prokaryotic dsDNA virus sp.]|nr:MAG: hypothetical protein GOVbin4162_114 [Prokaryotic dsDNA virus sp.]|tara:strand:- start:1041 stop:1298 length:258 start_codon:yes stop_codon:yes gene_type:complete
MFNLFKSKPNTSQVERKLQSQELMRSKLAITLIELEAVASNDLIDDLMKCLDIVGNSKLKHGSFICGGYNIVVNENSINIVKMTN